MDNLWSSSSDLNIESDLNTPAAANCGGGVLMQNGDTFPVLLRMIPEQWLTSKTSAENQGLSPGFLSLIHI